MPASVSCTVRPMCEMCSAARASTSTTAAGEVSSMTDFIISRGEKPVLPQTPVERQHSRRPRKLPAHMAEIAAAPRESAASASLPTPTASTVPCRGKRAASSAARAAISSSLFTVGSSTLSASTEMYFPAGRQAARACSPAEISIRVMSTFPKR